MKLTLTEERYKEGVAPDLIKLVEDARLGKAVARQRNALRRKAKAYLQAGGWRR
jgi:hypothetical protein